ncbi:hypothetical protein GCM10023208_06310 [Erythrobacter westpacificensis]|uniref:Transferrin-binding protein B C-lobe/N-lobe beta barrel domain-containing protein n=1 Tax=Erythrobacter westpacificensis TaxID=1055231 RepID=A0ABP9K2S4_9SPHN
MLRKYALFVGVAALGALVTSCGGDDTGTPTPSPTATGTATPTPTPTPTPIVDFDLQGDFATESTNANYAFAYFTPDAGGTETFSGASRLNGLATISLALAPEQVQFGFPDLDDPVSFGATELTDASATVRSYARGDEKLVLELPFEHVLRVSYESQVDFTRDTTDGVLRGERTALFFNPVTTDEDIAADLDYSGSVEVVGGDPTVTPSGAISAQDVTFTISEADSSINGTIEIYRDNNGTPELVAKLVFERTTNSSGTVTGGVLNSNGTFSGILTDEANQFAGTFAGALSGPDREEIFILFSVSGTTDADDDGDVDEDDDRRFVGSFIGKR